MALLILTLLQRIFLMSSLMQHLVWMIFFMLLIKLLPILGTISGKTVKLMVFVLICLTFLFGVIILIANILKRAFSSQLAAKLRNRLLVLSKPFFVPFGAVVYSVINIKLGEHIVAFCQFIH